MDDGSTVWAHHIELPAHAPSASRARGFVVQHLVEHDLPHLADDLQLVVTELATNALRHALTPFTVTLEAVAHIVLLGVQDGSPHAPVMRACVPRDTSGRGIKIVELLSRDWGVTAHADGGKTVWAAFATWDSPEPARRATPGTPVRPATTATATTCSAGTSSDTRLPSKVDASVRNACNDDGYPCGCGANGAHAAVTRHQ